MKRTKRVSEGNPPERKARRSPEPPQEGQTQEVKGERLSVILERRRQKREEREQVNQKVQRKRRVPDEVVAELGKGIETPPPVAILASNPVAQRDWELHKYGKVHWFEYECLHCRGKLYPVRLVESSSKRSKGLIFFCPACFYRATAWT